MWRILSQCKIIFATILNTVIVWVVSESLRNDKMIRYIRCSHTYCMKYIVAVEQLLLHLPLLTTCFYSQMIRSLDLTSCLKCHQPYPFNVQEQTLITFLLSKRWLLICLKVSFSIYMRFFDLYALALYHFVDKKFHVCSNELSSRFSLMKYV